MKIPSILLTLLSIFIGNEAISQDITGKQAPAANGEWKTITESTYTVQYPPAWGLNLDKKMGTEFIILSPLESEQDKFKENVNLLIQDLSGKNIDLDKFASISEEQIKTLVTNSSLILSKRIKTAGIEYQKVIYSGDQGVYHLKYEQYYWVVGDKAYVLTLTCEQNKFDRYKEDGEKILNSFTFKN